MFEGAKTWVFWVGLVIFALACVEVFSVVWFGAVMYRPYLYLWQLVEILTPFAVGGVVFIIVGLYMMKSGVKKQTKTSSEESEKEPKTSTTVDPHLFATRTGALLDFYSDRAVAHASLRARAHGRLGFLHLQDE